MSPLFCDFFGKFSSRRVVFLEIAPPWVILDRLRSASDRRVVAMGVDPHSTAASDVMTPNPTTVLTEDSAMEALGIMLGRHFRHLPVRRIKRHVEIWM